MLPRNLRFTQSGRSIFTLGSNDVARCDTKYRHDWTYHVEASLTVAKFFSTLTLAFGREVTMVFRRTVTLLLLIQDPALTFAGVAARQTNVTNVLDWIDPLIGSRNGGNVFAGATLPYGMVKGSQYLLAPTLHLLTTCSGRRCRR
jgi:hypothetical protein